MLLSTAVQEQDGYQSKVSSSSYESVATLWYQTELYVSIVKHMTCQVSFVLIMRQS